MLSGRAITLQDRSDSGELLLEYPVSGTDEELEHSVKVLYRVSFEELVGSYLQYDSIIWVMLSLLLVLAWGVGLLMLLYLPFRRYVVQKELLSRKLFITQHKVIYRATRPSFLPFMGLIKIEKTVPLHLVIDVVVEQGCLQSIHGLCTFRIECIAHGKPAPVDELQFQGVTNPELLKKVIITEAARSVQEVGSWKHSVYSREGPSTPRMRSLIDGPSLSRFQSPSGKVRASSAPGHALFEPRGGIPEEVLLHKLEEVNRSVKKIETLLLGSHSQAS